MNNIIKTLEYLYYECKSSGGDGDALWYSKFAKIDKILPLLESYNSQLKFPWSIQKLNDKTILWSDHQESIVITTDKSLLDNAPDWSQLLLNN